MRRLWLFFNPCQREEIRLGKENGLSDKEISIYAKHRFGSLAMREIRLGLEQRLDLDAIKMYANKKFNWMQMQAIREGFLMGLSKEQVLQYAKPSYRDWQMRSISYGFAYGLTLEESERIMGKFWRILEFAYTNHIPLETFWFWMEKERSNLNEEQMKEVLLGALHGLGEKEIAKYDYNCFTPEQMREIRLGFEHGLTEDEIGVYANYHLEEQIMAILREDLEENHEALLSEAPQ